MGEDKRERDSGKTPTTGPTTREQGKKKTEEMADPSIHDGMARQPGGPEPSDEVGGWRNPI